MTQPTLLGRRLPPNDWEGDDFTPGAFGAYVTCQDTAAGRALYYATNGKVDFDGREIRARIQPFDSSGVSLRQVSLAIQSMTSPVRSLGWGLWSFATIRSWLAQAKGLVVDGQYWTVPAAYREQAGADFLHAMFISHYSPTLFSGRGGYRVWDPLNKDLAGYGKNYPRSAIEPFITSLDGLVGWLAPEELAIEPLPERPSTGVEPMTNLFPLTVHRVADLPKGTELEKTPGGERFTTLTADVELGLIDATVTHYKVADGDVGVWVARSKVRGILTKDKTVGA